MKMEPISLILRIIQTASALLFQKSGGEYIYVHTYKYTCKKEIDRLLHMEEILLDGLLGLGLWKTWEVGRA